MGRTACTEPQCLYKGALYFSRYTERFVFHYDEKFTCRIGTDYTTIVTEILILEQFV